MYDSRTQTRESTVEANDYTGTGPAPGTPRQRRNIAWYVAAVLAVILLGVIAWWQFSQQRLERQFAAERVAMTQAFEAERQAAVTAAQEASRPQIESAYRLFGTTFGWAVRSAMLRENLDQVDQYFTQLVQSKQVQLAALASTDGKILLASDRNLQDSAFSSHFPESLLKVREVTVVSSGSGPRHMAIPVLGLTDQLGVIVLALNEAATPVTAPVR
jgi:hypothetical protein